MTTISDDFNRAGPGLGANWTTLSGNPLIVASTYYGTDTTDIFNGAFAKYSASGLATNDCDMTIIVNVQATHAVIGYARCLSAGDVSQGYGFEVRGHAAGLLVSITRLDAGVATYLLFEKQSGIGAAAGVDHTLRMTLVGSVIEVFLDGVFQATVTESTYSTGTFIFLGSEHADSGINSFTASDATVPSAPTELRTVAENDGASLVWPVTPNGGALITDYLVEKNVNGGGWTTVTHSAFTAPEFHVTGLTTSDSVIFRVSAINSVGTGSASPTSKAITVLGIRSIAHAPTPTLGRYMGNYKRLFWNGSGPGNFLPLRFPPSITGAASTGAVGTSWDSAGAKLAIDYLWATPAGGATPLVVADLTVASTIDNVALTQHNVLVVADLTVASTLDAVVLTQHNVLAVADLTVASALDAVVVTQHHTLAVADLTGASAVDAVALTQHNVLAVADLTGASVLDNVDLTQHNVLAVDDLTSASTIENVTLGVGTTTLVVADLDVASTLDDTVLTQHNVLAVEDLTGASVVDSVVLTQHNVLAVDDLVGASTIDDVILTQHHALAVDELAVAATLDAVTLGVAGALSPDNLAVASTIENVALTQHHVLVVQGLSVAASVEAVALTQHQVLVVADLAVASTLGSVTLTQHYFLVVANLTVAVELTAAVPDVIVEPGPVIRGRDPAVIYAQDPGVVTARDPLVIYGQDPTPVRGRDARILQGVG